jgi:hypothetical protein
VRITSQIKYRKSVWGFVRTVIDKNVTAGILESFTVLGNEQEFYANLRAFILSYVQCLEISRVVDELNVIRKVV